MDVIESNDENQDPKLKNIVEHLFLTPFQFKTFIHNLLKTTKIHFLFFYDLNQLIKLTNIFFFIKSREHEMGKITFVIGILLL